MRLSKLFFYWCFTLCLVFFKVPFLLSNLIMDTNGLGDWDGCVFVIAINNMHLYWHFFPFSRLVFWMNVQTVKIKFTLSSTMEQQHSPSNSDMASLLLWILALLLVLISVGLSSNFIDYLNIFTFEMKFLYENIIL